MIERTIKKLSAYGLILGGGFLAFPREVVKVPPNKLCRSVPFVVPSRLFRLCLLPILESSSCSRFRDDLGVTAAGATEVESAMVELLMEEVSPFSFAVDVDSTERPKRPRRCLAADGTFSPCRKGLTDTTYRKKI